MTKMKNDIIPQSNCSEQVFKLTGSFKEIQGEILNMLNSIENDWKSWGTSGKNSLTPQEAKQLSDMRKTVKAVKKLEDFQKITFPFTTNYETYFKEDSGGLYVATCNNHDWDDVDCIPSNKDYHEIAHYDYWLVKYCDRDYMLLEEEYPKDNAKARVKIFNNVGYTDKDVEYELSVHLMNKETELTTKDGKIIRIWEIDDSEMKDKMLALAELQKGVR